MNETSINPVKYVVIGILLIAVILGLLFLPLAVGKAQTNQKQTQTKSIGFADSISANTLCSAGLGCDNVAATQSNSNQSNGLLSSLFGGSSNNSKVDPIITVVNVDGQSAVYRIIDGKRHSLPTTEIFNSYGFSLEMVQNISSAELKKYPMARLFIVQGDKAPNPTIYYLTDGGMIRPMLNDKVFYSYGNRKEDIITINQKEFNYYPRSRFMYVERPEVNRDIYQISGGIKQYLTPVAVKRMGLHESEIAPVNQIEFDAYPEGEPVIF